MGKTAKEKTIAKVMEHKTLWNDANKHAVKRLQSEVPSSGPVLNKKERPKLEAFRQMSNAYYEHHNNRWLNPGHGSEVSHAAKSAGVERPDLRKLKEHRYETSSDRNRRAEEYAKFEHLARKVTAEALVEQRSSLKQAADHLRKQHKD